MADSGEPVVPSGQSQWPAVRPVALVDLLEVLAAGLGDFRRAPLYDLFFGAVYTVGGWLLVFLLIYADLPFLVYPLAAGFALIAPLVATGFYAISHLLEEGEPVSGPSVRHLIWKALRQDLGWMALVTSFTFFIWMDIAALLFFGFLGLNALSAESLVTKIFTTPSGLLFLVIGNTAGAVIALAVFSFSVTSFPMIFDRNCDFVTAMVTSVRVVLASPKVMVVWCVLIAGLVGLSLLSGFLGFLIVLPVLGHASWHLYRRSVAPAGETDSK